jgi:glycosyltransferase involved in cell wall biosynthesis
LWYRRFLGGVRPDIVHVQHPLERALYVRIVNRVERWRTPLVVTAHSLFGEHSDQTIHRLMAPNLRAADRVIAVSDHIASQASELGVDPTRIRVIRSGVDTVRFRPRDSRSARQRLGLDDQSRVVLFVGNLEPRKQVDVLLHALTGVRPHVSDVVLLVVGSGQSAGLDDQTDTLNMLTRELALEGSVRFLGRVDDQRLLDCYAAADVFALPSSSEAQGIAALEAMAAGLPVVASAVGGLLGTIQDGVSGFLVNSGDPDELAARLVRLFCDDSLRRGMSSNARSAVERDFAWPRAVSATIELYREVLACRS